MLKMRRIPAPEWSKPFAVTVDKGFGEREYSLLSPHHDMMLECVQQAIEQYVNDDQKTAQGSERAETEDEDFIPDRIKLTGEYYIAWEYYYCVQTNYPKVGLLQRRQPTELHYWVSIMVHCLGTPQTKPQMDLDYLGLQLYLGWDAAKHTLFYPGDIEASSI